MARRNLLLRYRALTESRRDLFSAPTQRDADLCHRPAAKPLLARRRRPTALPHRSAGPQAADPKKGPGRTDGEEVDTEAALKAAGALVKL
jgi:hypothetical protein